MSDARCTLTGRFSAVSDAEEAAACRDAYMQQHPEAYWIDFGDFSFFRMDEVVAANLVGGFGRIAKVTPAAYWDARPDPVAGFSGPVCKHMNADHAEATVAMVKHFVGVTVTEARMLSLDRLGVSTECVLDGELVNVRLTFPQPITNRAGLKQALVDMTKQAQAAT